MIRTYFQMLIEEELPDAVGKMKQFASGSPTESPAALACAKPSTNQSRAGSSHPRRRILRRADSPG